MSWECMLKLLLNKKLNMTTQAYSAVKLVTWAYTGLLQLLRGMGSLCRKDAEIENYNKAEYNRSV